MGYEETKVLHEYEDGRKIRLPSKEEDFEVMERMADEEIVAQMRGTMLPAYVYRFKDHRGDEVVDLSKDGVLAFANLRKGIKLERVFDNIREKEDDEYIIIYEATDINTGDTREGAAQQFKASPKGVKDQYALAKAVSKAQRNALKNILNVDAWRQLIMIYLDQQTEQEKEMMKLAVGDNVRKFNIDYDTFKKYVSDNYNNEFDNLEVNDLKKVNSFIASKKGSDHFKLVQLKAELDLKIESLKLSKTKIEEFVFEKKNGLAIDDLDVDTLSNLIDFISIQNDDFKL